MEKKVSEGIKQNTEWKKRSEMSQGLWNKKIFSSCQLETEGSGEGDTIYDPTLGTAALAAGLVSVFVSFSVVSMSALGSAATEVSATASGVAGSAAAPSCNYNTIWLLDQFKPPLATIRFTTKSNLKNRHGQKLGHPFKSLGFKLLNSQFHTKR